MNIKTAFGLFLLLQVFSMHAQQFNWATSVTGEEYEYGIKSIKDAQGNTYIIGFTTGSPFIYDGVTYATNGAGGDVFFAKLDANKNLVWLKPIGGDDALYSDSPQDIHIDPFGDIYLTFKSTGNNCTYDGQVLTGINSPGQYSGEAVLLKVNSNGNYLWHDSGTVSSLFRAITTDSSGNAYITGTFDSNITLGNTITLTNPSTATTRDLLVAKYQSDGTILWAKNAGGMPHNTFATGADLEINSQTNEVIVLGKGEGAVLFDGLPMPTIAGSDESIVLISYSVDGTQNWVKRVLNGQTSAFSYGTTLDISASGVLGVCGQTYNSGLVGFYSSNGSVISDHTYPSSNELRMYAITFNEFNDAYLSGFCTSGGTLGISPGTVTLASTTGFIVKMDIFQQVQWVESFYSSISANRIHYANGVISYAGRIDAPFSYNSGQTVIVNNTGDALFGEVIDYQLLNVESFLPNNNIVYPNPTTGSIFIESDALQLVEIYNITGTLLQSTDQRQINLSQHDTGIYFVKIITGTGSTVKKIVLK